MFYYKCYNKLLFSFKKYKEMEKTSQSDIQNYQDIIYFLFSNDPATSRRSFCISDPSLLYLQKEGLNLLQLDGTTDFHKLLPNWLIKKIEERKVMAINTNFPNWKELLLYNPPVKWRVNIAGLGDVGGTLLIGLYLMGGDCIESIGIYDKTPEKIKRWYYEMNQVHSPKNLTFPKVYILEEKEVFDCDMLVFSIAKSVPPVGSNVKDVRMIQFEENAKIIEDFGVKARENNFKGIFAVVSDPVDLLCKALLKASNKNEQGFLDFCGLAPEQIRGYGLGVMHSRAAYYAKDNPKTYHYIKEGRAFGPHGEDLVIADSIQNYNETLSLYLTEKAKAANLEVRKTGFKPYIAPALSSGALSILATIKGDWHYSATYMGGVYMGAQNRLNLSGTEIERLNLPTPLLSRLKKTYLKLGDMI